MTRDPFADLTDLKDAAALIERLAWDPARTSVTRQPLLELVAEFRDRAEAVRTELRDMGVIQ